MTLFSLFLVAVVQGLTEFLPVSSSGHLILLPALTGREDQGLLIDVAVHVGTLGAVILYFRADVARALSGLPLLLAGRLDDPRARLAAGLVVGTIPVIVAGALLRLSGFDLALRSVAVIGWTTLIFGIVLYVADQWGPRRRVTADWTLRDAVVMGLWQALALIPGTSRSGATISAARMLGYEREDAARLSMLMSIPTILASGILLGIEASRNSDAGMVRDGALAAGFAFIAALIALRLMFKLLKFVSFTPYVVYRIGLGAALLWIVYA